MGKKLSRAAIVYAFDLIFIAPFIFRIIRIEIYLIFMTFFRALNKLWGKNLVF
jgi:hypothetical protein